MRYVNFPGFQQMGRSLSGRVVLYGTGRRARSLIQEYLLPGGRVSSLYAVSDSRKHKPFFLSDGSEIPVYQPEMLLKEREPVTVLLTQEASLMDAILRLKALHLPDSVSYCIAVREYLSAACCGSGSHERPPIMPGHQIPKLIHCIWFGSQQKPELYDRCMETWSKVMPDYEIRVWNKDTWDVDQHEFTKSAAQEEAWAFISDYVRLNVIGRCGGIYLDMDVQVLKRFDDLLDCGAFFAYDADDNFDLGSGFGAQAGHPLVLDLMHAYDGKKFTNFSDWNQPSYLRQIFLDHGIRMDGSFQISGSTVAYPRNRFTPYDSIGHICYADLSDTYSLHLFNSGWLKGDKMTRRDARYAGYQAVIDTVGREEFETASRRAIAKSAKIL